MKKLILSLLVLFALNTSAQELLPIAKKALYETNSIWYTNFANYPKNLKKMPIGVFDSGTGGFTVLEKILALDRFNNKTGEEKPDGIPDFIQEDFQYLGDQANMPYGRYASEGKELYLRELAVKDALFLLNNHYSTDANDKAMSQKKDPVKILVIACNTATAYGLGAIGNMLRTANSPVKVIGVVNAGSESALENLSGRKDAAIGVLATPGTISSGVYERTLREMKPQAMKELDVVNQPGVGFAEAVDEEKDFVNRQLTTFSSNYRGPQFGDGEWDIHPEILEAYNFDFTNNAAFIERDSNGKPVRIQLNSSDNYARYNLMSLIDKAKKQKLTRPLDCVILGCTHYPFCLSTMQKLIEELRVYTDKNGEKPYASLIAKDLKFIDPAENTAYQCYKALKDDNLLKKGKKEGKLLPFISVAYKGLPAQCLDNDGNLRYEFKYGREINTEDQTTLVVPINDNTMSADNLERIGRLLPLCYKKINEAKKQ